MKKANDTMRPPIVAPWNPPRRGGKRGFDGGRGRGRKGDQLKIISKLFIEILRKIDRKLSLSRGNFRGNKRGRFQR